jgi:hypothetical protein
MYTTTYRTPTMWEFAAIVHLHNHHGLILLDWQERGTTYSVGVFTSRDAITSP